MVKAIEDRALSIYGRWTINRNVEHDRSPLAIV
jgi:hypothetical protein